MGKIPSPEVHIVRLPPYTEIAIRDDSFGDLLRELIPERNQVSRTNLARLIDSTAITKPEKITEAIGRERLDILRKAISIIAENHFHSDKIEIVRDEIDALLTTKDKNGKPLTEMTIGAFMILQAHLGLLCLLASEENGLWNFFEACDHIALKGKRRKMLNEKVDEIGRTDAHGC